MKKLLIIAAILAMIALPALAGMDSVNYSVRVIGIGSGSTATNSATYVLRGLIESIYVNIDGVSTSTYTVASDQGTIFTKSISADTKFYPRAAGQTTAGAAYTWTESGQNSGGVVSNTVTSAQYDKIAVAGDVTVTVVQTAAANADSATNTPIITVIYNK